MKIFVLVGDTEGGKTNILHQVALQPIITVDREETNKWTVVDYPQDPTTYNWNFGMGKSLDEFFSEVLPTNLGPQDIILILCWNAKAHDSIVLNRNLKRKGIIFVDPMLWARKDLNGVMPKDKSIASLVRYFGISLNGGKLHDARTDTRCLRIVLSILVMLDTVDRAAQNQSIEEIKKGNIEYMKPIWARFFTEVLKYSHNGTMTRFERMVQVHYGTCDLVQVRQAAQNQRERDQERPKLQSCGDEELRVFYKAHWFQTASDFCKKFSIDPSNFSKWRRGIRATDPASSRAVMKFKSDSLGH